MTTAAAAPLHPSDEMIRIECTCKGCRGRAVQLGCTILAADVPERHAALIQDRAGRHGFVYTANDPSPVGRLVSQRLGIQGVKIAR